MTPIWQAECPECAEGASDDLWRAAFETWPRQDGNCEVPPQATEIFGLQEEMVPRLSQPVCPARQSCHPAFSTL